MNGGCEKTMTLETIRQAVLANAESQATRIIDTAEKVIAKKLDAQKTATKDEFDRLCASRMQALEEEHSRKFIQFKGAAGKRILEKKNALLKALFKRAKDQILSWPRQKYAGVMTRLIEKAAGDNRGKIRVHPKEQEVFQEILLGLNKERGDLALSMDLTDSLSERGGFIFIGDDFEVDHTLDTTLDAIERDMLPAMAAKLFPGRPEDGGYDS